VSHIENVMAREYKEKSTRRLRRTEDTTTTSKEQEIEKLTDTTSTDRFEMNQEVASVLSEQTSMGVHANVHYGTKTLVLQLMGILLTIPLRKNQTIKRLHMLKK